jgi:hypothetical protein
MISHSICVLYIFIRVFIRSTAQEGGDNYDDPFTSIVTGQPLGESFKTRSRADEFAESVDGYLLIVILPFFLVITISDVIFAWNLVVQTLIFFLESGKPRLFKLFTCNRWKTKDFREKYMMDEENDVDSISDLSLNTGLNIVVIPGIEPDDIVDPEQVLAEIDGE